MRTISHSRSLPAIGASNAGHACAARDGGLYQQEVEGAGDRGHPSRKLGSSPNPPEA